MNKTITISSKIKTVVPDTRLGVIKADVKYQKENRELWAEIEKEIQRIQKLTTQEIKLIPQIATTREAYRLLGKEPSRYRPSAEALYRRIVQGKGLYKISNIVDSINLASLLTGYSIGGYDYEKIDGDIIFDLGRPDDVYFAIGRGQINVANLPVFRDKKGAFGSPTTDSERTKITSQTQRVLLIVINFGVKENFEEDMVRIMQILEKFSFAKDIEHQVIR